MNIKDILFAVLILGALGGGFGAILSFASKKFEVKVDPRISQIREHLGGANCGACGYAGCDALADAIVSGACIAGSCPVIGKEDAAAIAAIMGVEAPVSVPKVARVLCQGEDGIAAERYDYVGYKSCRAAASLAGGPRACPFACLGMGDCIDACHFDAIRIRNGIASVDPEKCTACGLCAAACPRGVIELVHRDSAVLVRCRNTEVARTARESCMKACIGCKKCEKTCRYDAIHVENGVARIDYEKCTRCGECVAGCPCGCITVG